MLVVTPIMTYFALPLVTRALRPWLPASVEQLAEPVLLLLAYGLRWPTRAGRGLLRLRLLCAVHGLLRLRCGGRSGALDDLVEFSPIQPDTAALRAVVDLDSVAFAHHDASSHPWGIA